MTEPAKQKCRHCNHPVFSVRLPDGRVLELDDRRIVYELSDSQVEPVVADVTPRDCYVPHHLICKGAEGQRTLPLEAFPLRRSST